METQQKFACDSEEKAPDLSVHHDFEELLLKRAKCQEEQHDLYPVIGHESRIKRYQKTYAFILTACLDAIAIV